MQPRPGTLPTRLRTAAVAVVLVVMAVGLLLIWPSRQITVDERLLVPRIPSGGTNGNAVVLLDQAWSRFRSTNELSELRQALNRNKPLDIEKARRIVATEGETLRLIHEAFRQQECELLAPPSRGTNPTIRRGWPSMMRLSILEAEFQEQSSRLNLLEHSMDVIRLSHRLEDSGGGSWEYLQAMSAKIQGLETMRRFAGEAEIDPQVLIRLAAELARYPANGSGLSNAFRWDFVSNFQFMTNQMSFVSSPTNSAVSIPTPTFLFDGDRVRQLSAVRTFEFLASIQPRWVASPVRQIVASRKQPMGWLSLLRGNAAGVVIQESLEEEGVLLVESKCREVNEVSATRVILALRAHQLMKGDLPSSLDALVPAFLDEVPLDNFDGQPLRYSREKRLVWSVGTDLRDNGGVAQDAQRKRLDDTFELGW